MSATCALTRTTSTAQLRAQPKVAITGGSDVKSLVAVSIFPITGPIECATRAKPILRQKPTLILVARGRKILLNDRRMIIKIRDPLAVILQPENEVAVVLTWGAAARDLML